MTFAIKKNFYAAEQERADVIEKRQDWEAFVEEIDPAQVIVIDESGLNTTDTKEHARTIGGNRVKAPKPHGAWDQTSIIGAVSIDEVVHVMSVEGSVDEDVFLIFISDLLKKVKPGHYIIMDNARFHKGDTIKEQIEKAGAHLVFLPPYSPDYSPIEKMWSKIKTIVKKLKPRNERGIFEALFHALSKITVEDLYSWFEDCGFNLDGKL